MAYYEWFAMISLVYSYYNNKPLFEKVRNYYLEQGNSIHIYFLDDGSKDEPLEADDMPSGWELYRIHQDLKWNY